MTHELHPIIYLLGKTGEEDFPLVLTIGREPNHDVAIGNFVKKIDRQGFAKMSGGVWMVAYSVLAETGLGIPGREFKRQCLARDASPILFANAFPECIPHEIGNKEILRSQLTHRIPEHLDNLFSNPLVQRVHLVVQHGVTAGEASQLGAGIIQAKCKALGIPYVGTPFFHNTNRRSILPALQAEQPALTSTLQSFVS